MIDLAAPRSRKSYPDRAIDCQEMLDVDFNRMMTDATISEMEMDRTLLRPKNCAIILASAT